MQDKEKVKINK